MTPQARIADLERENEDLCRRIAERDREMAALRERVAELVKQLEKWKRGHAEGSKRRTSRPEGTSRGPGKRPGRKVGHPGAQRPVPERIDSEVCHGMPERCSCGGEVSPTDEARSTIVQDIPPVEVQNVRHVARVGICKACKKKVSAALPGDVPSGQSIAKVQVGPNLHAMCVGLRFEQRVNLANIGAFVGQWFGVTISAGGIAPMITRLRERSPESYAEIENTIRASAVVGADETGLRQNGKTGWGWWVRTDRASLFSVSTSRGGHVLDAIDRKSVV